MVIKTTFYHLYSVLKKWLSTLFYNDDNYSLKKSFKVCRIKGQEIAVNHLRGSALEKKILFDDCLNMYRQYIRYIHRDTV